MRVHKMEPQACLLFWSNQKWTAYSITKESLWPSISKMWRNLDAQNNTPSFLTWDFTKSFFREINFWIKKKSFYGFHNLPFLGTQASSPGDITSALMLCNMQTRHKYNTGPDRQVAVKTVTPAPPPISLPCSGMGKSVRRKRQTCWGSSPSGRLSPRSSCSPAEQCWRWCGGTAAPAAQRSPRSPVSKEEPCHTQGPPAPHGACGATRNSGLSPSFPPSGVRPCLLDMCFL